MKLDASTFNDFKAAGVSMSGANGSQVIWKARTAEILRQCDSCGEFIRLEIDGQLVFTKGGKSFTVSKLKAEWPLNPDPEEPFGVIAGTAKGITGGWFNLIVTKSTTNVKVNKAKKTRTLTITMRADINQPTDLTYTDAINSSLGTTVFQDGMRLGTVQAKVKTTVMCKNKKCTR